MNDPYEVLGVARNATVEEIEQARRRLAIRWHPDRHPAGAREQAEEQMKRINVAADALTAAKQRERLARSSSQTTAARPAAAPPAADESFQDTGFCAHHAERPRVHQCVVCRTPLCAECTRMVQGWSWCIQCASAPSLLSDPPASGKVSETKTRRKWFNFSRFSK